MASEISPFPSSRFIGSLVQTVNDQIRSWIEEENIPIPVIAATLQKILRLSFDSRLTDAVEDVMDSQDGVILEGMFNDPSCFHKADFPSDPASRAIRDERISVAKRYFTDLLNYWLNEVFKVERFNLDNACANANNLFTKEYKKLPLEVVPEQTPASRAQVLLVKAKESKNAGDFAQAFTLYRDYITLVSTDGLTLDLFRKILRFYSHVSTRNGFKSIFDLKAYQTAATEWLTRFKESPFAASHEAHMHIFTLNHLLHFAYYASQIRDRVQGTDQVECQQLIDHAVREVLAYIERHRANIPASAIRKCHLLLSLMVDGYHCESEAQQKILAQEILTQELLRDYNKSLRDGDPEKIVVPVKKIETLAAMSPSDIDGYFQQQQFITSALREDYALLLDLLRKLSNKSINFTNLNHHECQIVIEAIREGMEDRDPNKEILRGIILKLNQGQELTDDERKNIDMIFENRRALLRALRMYAIRTRLQTAIVNFALEDFIQINLLLEDWYYTQPDQETFNLPTRAVNLACLVRFCANILNQQETNPALINCHRYMANPGIKNLTDLLSLFFMRYIKEQAKDTLLTHTSIYPDRDEFRLVAKAWLQFKNINSDTPLESLDLDDLSILTLILNEQLSQEGFSLKSIQYLVKLCNAISNRADIPSNHPMLNQVRQLFDIKGPKKLYVFDWDDTLVDQASDPRTGKKPVFHKLTQLRLFTYLLANPNNRIAILSSGSETAEIKATLIEILGEEALSRVQIFDRNYFRGETFKKRYDAACRALPLGAPHPSPKVYAVQNDAQFIQMRRGVSNENVIVLDDSAGTELAMQEAGYSALLALPLVDDSYLQSFALADAELSTRLTSLYQQLVSPSNQGRAEKTSLDRQVNQTYSHFMTAQREISYQMLHLADKYRRKIEKEERPNPKHYLFYQLSSKCYELAISRMKICIKTDLTHLLRAYLNNAELERKICRLQYGLPERERINMADHYAKRIRHLFELAALLRSEENKALRGSSSTSSLVALLYNDIQALISEISEELRSAAALPAEKLPTSISAILREYNISSVQNLIRSIQQIGLDLQSDLSMAAPPPAAAAAAAASSSSFSGWMSKLVTR